MIWYFTLSAIILDIISIAGALLLAYYIRLESGLIPFLVKYPFIPPLSYYVRALFVIIPIWLFSNYAFGLYRDWGRRKWIDNFFAVIGSSVIAMLITTGVAFFYRGFSYSRLVLLIFLFLGVVFISLNRLLIENILKSYWKKNKFVKRSVIVGKSDVGDLLLERLSGGNEIGYQLVGVASVEELSGSEREEWKEDCGGEEYIGSLDDLQNWVEEEEIDEVFIVSDVKRDKVVRAIREAEDLGCELRLVPDILGIMRSKVQGEDRLGIPLFSLKKLPLNAFQKFIKRALDVIASFVFLVISSPIMLISAILIKATSRGPVFYKQKRVGLDGEEFTMYKFRSMREDAEEETGAVWATKDDPRRTTIGKILRKTSLDELPQLFNVLKGDMSIVGPRPERPVLVEEFARKIPRYLDRHHVKCGITGWAQVNGLRGDTSLEKRIEYDIYYIENWSIIFDMKIIILTFFNLFAPEEI